VSEQIPGLKRHSSSDSNSDSKRGKCEDPDSKLCGSSQKSKSPIENFISLYIFVKLLGFGAFGVVKLMQHRISGINYAVKIVKKIDSQTDDKTRNEIRLGMKLNSDYVCKVHGYHEDDNHFYIIMDYLEGMDLCDFLCKDPKFFINNPQYFWFVVVSILRGLAYLHSKKIAHMDIKPQNVYLVLDKQGNIIGVKLIDFGLSMEIDDTTKCFKGTHVFMAPEFFHRSTNIDCKVDIWSLAIMAFGMIREYLPIQIASSRKNPDQRNSEICRNIQRLLMDNLFNPFEKESEDQDIKEMERFIQSCLFIYPTDRPTADDLLKKISSDIHQMSL
jgi:serine/threonine protein kinase